MSNDMDGFRKVLMCLGGEEITGAEPRGGMPGEPVRIPGGTALSQVIAAGPYRADLTPTERYIYVSSRPKHNKIWNDWKSGNVLSVRCVPTPASPTEVLSADARGALIHGATGVLLYEEHGDQHPALYFDFGVAMALGLPIVYVGPNHGEGALIKDGSNVTVYSSLMGALEYLAAVLA